MTFVKHQKEVGMPFEESAISWELVVAHNPHIRRLHLVLSVDTVGKMLGVATDFVSPMIAERGGTHNQVGLANAFLLLLEDFILYDCQRLEGFALKINE